MQLSQETLRALKASIEAFFSKRGLRAPKIRAPHLAAESTLPAQDVTGMITLSGVPGGLLYFTSGKRMLDLILVGMMQPISADLRLDLVGELANIFSGNLRVELGKLFEIAPPILIDGPIDRIRFAVKDTPYVLPFEYDGEVGQVVIAFDTSNKVLSRIADA